MEKPTTIRVVSAVADKKQAILYLEDGNQLMLKQGDHRLGDLLDIIIPITVKGEVAVVDLKDFSVYAAFEQKTAGMTKFFKMAKNKVSGWFGGNTDPKPVQAHVPAEGQKAILAAVMGETMTEDHVTQHGSQIDPSDEVAADEVVVAVVTTPATATAPEKRTVIPGVNAIKPLIDHAVKTNSAGAVQAFLNRCAGFIDKRQHSVDDLMRFLEKGDLPLAEDGSIIAYKMLCNASGQPGVFVDCHSGKIQQRVGSYVCVNEDLVDLNRRNECSNGLHIARRSYLGGFGGDVCVLCKIDPEDVMVVPHNDANKVRVKGYHILGVLSDEAMKALQANKPMTGEEEALTMVYNAIKGDHIDRIEQVKVNGQYGSNVVVTKLKHDSRRGRYAYSHTGSDLKKAAALDDESNITGSIDPRDINKRVTTEHEKLTGTRPDVVIIDDLENDEDYTCDECGVEVPVGETMCDDCMEELTALDKPEEETSPSYGDFQRDYPDADKEELEDAADFHDAVVANGGTNEGMGGFINEPEPVAEPEPTPAPKATAPTKAEQARALYDAGDMAALQAFKKKAKKGWPVLGFTEKEVKKILK